MVLRPEESRAAAKEEVKRIEEKMRQMRYRVWVIANPPNAPDFYPVGGPKEGAVLINKLGDQQLKMPWIHSNAMGLEVFEDGEWTDWYDEETGEDVDALCRP